MCASMLSVHILILPFYSTKIAQYGLITEIHCGFLDKEEMCAHLHRGVFHLMKPLFIGFCVNEMERDVRLFGRLFVVGISGS